MLLDPIGEQSVEQVRDVHAVILVQQNLDDCAMGCLFQHDRMWGVHVGLPRFPFDWLPSTISNGLTANRYTVNA